MNYNSVQNRQADTLYIQSIWAKTNVVCMKQQSRACCCFVHSRITPAFSPNARRNSVLK